MPYLIMLKSIEDMQWFFFMCSGGLCSSLLKQQLLCFEEAGELIAALPVIRVAQHWASVLSLLKITVPSCSLPEAVSVPTVGEEMHRYADCRFS